MKIRIASDVHTEFLQIDEIEDYVLDCLPELPEDNETTLILAGDIGSMHKPVQLIEFIERVSKRFKEVLYIPGNHEYYGGNLKSTPEIIRELIADLGNVFFSTMGGANIGGVPVVMATLWTNYDNGDRISMLQAHQSMNDYRHIKRGNSLATPQDMLEIHNHTVEWLNGVILDGTIVVTHHMPSFKSVPEAYKYERVNGAYASDLEQLILDTKPALWIHGHTHDACDYKIGDTRILCNPHGYGRQHTNNGYNPRLVVDIAEGKKANI